MLSVKVIIIDVLRRAGADVTVASVEDSLQVTSILDQNASKRARNEYDVQWGPSQFHLHQVDVGCIYLQVEMSRKVKLVADKLIGDVSQESFDAIALPVGAA